jgi:hypothetical protein
LPWEEAEQGEYDMDMIGDGGICHTLPSAASFVVACAGAVDYARIPRYSNKVMNGLQNPTNIFEAVSGSELIYSIVIVKAANMFELGSGLGGGVNSISLVIW